MPRVMISGWTRNTPTPMPVTRPGQRGRAERDGDARTQPPGWLTRVAMTKPAIDATSPTDRSMPPVSMVSVWHPARIASGTAARRIDADPVGVDDARVERARLTMTSRTQQDR